jgi:hypothetical protein
MSDCEQTNPKCVDCTAASLGLAYITDSGMKVCIGLKPLIAAKMISAVDSLRIARRPPVALQPEQIAARGDGRASVTAVYREKVAQA